MSYRYSNRLTYQDLELKHGNLNQKMYVNFHLLIPLVSTLAFFRDLSSAAFILDRMDWLGLISSCSSSSSFSTAVVSVGRRSRPGRLTTAEAAPPASAFLLDVRVGRTGEGGSCFGKLLLLARLSAEFSQNELWDRNWDGSWMWESSLEKRKFH